MISYNDTNNDLKPTFLFVNKLFYDDEILTVKHPDSLKVAKIKLQLVERKQSNKVSLKPNKT